MNIGKIIVSIIVFVVAGIHLFLSVMSFMEKGKLLNNAFIYASNDEREKMNKKPYYRQSAIVFLMICAEYTCIGLSCLFDNVIIYLLQVIVLIILFVYATTSSAKLNKQENK